MPLVITIRNLDAGTSTRFESSQSPVRIGRNALNELVLEAGFVSQFHGVVRFGADGVHYKDLGSTNGSLLEGRPLARNVEVIVAPQSDLRIGPLRLEAELRAALHNTPQGGAPSAGTAAAAKHVRTLYGMLRESPVGAAPRSHAGGAPVATAPLSEAAASPFSASSSSPRTGSEATIQIARELASRLLPPGREPTTEGEGRRLIESVAVILDAFAHSFLGLRRGMEQTGAELGVRTVPSRSPLYMAKDHQQVLAHLLDPRAEPQQMAQELVGVFADFGVHQVALLNGITESVKALLNRVAGTEAGAERGSGRVKLWPFRSEEAKLADTIRELLEDDRQLHAAIFGDEFGVAYAAGTLGGHQKGKP